MKYLTLKENDALKQLMIITQKTKKQIEMRINIVLVDKELMYESDEEMFGYTIQDIIDDSGYSLEEIAPLFWNLSDYRETIELMPSIQFFNELNDCPQCGCETKKENDAEETYVSCTVCELEYVY